MLKQGDATSQTGENADLGQYRLLDSWEEIAVLHRWWQHLQE